jgi:hypothetical protein
VRTVEGECPITHAQRLALWIEVKEIGVREPVAFLVLQRQRMAD